MVEFSMKELLEAGVYFGHQKSRWNPKMKPFIYGVRNGIHIINLQKTFGLLHEAVNFMKSVTEKGDEVLIVGTKRQAKNVVESEAKRGRLPYVSFRWLGGMLTNFVTVRQSVKKLQEIESLLSIGSVEKLPKKEILFLEKHRNKLLKNLEGIRDMTRLPRALFVIDPKSEEIAVREARSLRISVVALTDTNCDPDIIDYVIPGNDDSLRSISLITRIIVDACIEGKEMHKARIIKDMGKEGEVQELKVDMASDSFVEVKELSDTKKEVIIKKRN